jgi:hypothetical protein
MKGYDDFFIVKKEERDFYDFKFLTKAVSRDESRYFMNFVFCEKEGDHIVMVTTDGHRMHILCPINAENYGIQEGYYQILTNTAKEIIFAHCDESGIINHGQFPDYKKVMPSGEIRDTLEDISFRKSNCYDTQSIIYFAKKVEDVSTFNINYLYDLSPFSWDVDFYKEEHKAVNFISKNKQAVIMPMNER